MPNAFSPIDPIRSLSTFSGWTANIVSFTVPLHTPSENYKVEIGRMSGTAVDYALEFARPLPPTDIRVAGGTYARRGRAIVLWPSVNADTGVLDVTVGALRYRGDDLTNGGAQGTRSVGDELFRLRVDLPGRYIYEVSSSVGWLDELLTVDADGVVTLAKPITSELGKGVLQFSASNRGVMRWTPWAVLAALLWWITLGLFTWLCPEISAPRPVH